MTQNGSTDFIPDLPPGPLDGYRKQASFCWKKLKLAFEDEDNLKLKMKVWQTLEADELFHPLLATPSADEQKRRAALQLVRFHQYKFYTEGIAKSNYRRKTRAMMTLNEAIASVNMNLSVKFALGVSLFSNAILSLGTERHLHFYTAAWNGELLSAIALTEVGHGSNTKKMRTTATYEPATRQFVIHTPDFQAAKCWVGNLGKTCTYALVFAQLVTADGSHGLHAFVVPIRDPTTLLPYPGIVVGDIGDKAGLNGIDNGFIMFQNYRIPRENLLNRLCDVSVEGEYETSFTNPEQQLGAALENLSAGRVGIMQESVSSLCSAVTIAVRYSAVRRQFGPDPDGDEQPIIEYQLQRWRLFPYVAAACALRSFIESFTDQYLDGVEKSNSGVKLTHLSQLVSEIHAMVSSSKPLLTWTCLAAIQACREACGGHGYLKASGLSELRDGHDAKVTYEGDNSVLMQQTSNWLLRQWGRAAEGEGASSPLGSASFLASAGPILRSRFRGSSVADVLSHSFVSSAYRWLLCWLLRDTDASFKHFEEKLGNRFTARSNVQVFRARTLSIAYAEHNVLEYFWKRCECPKLEPSIRAVLEKWYLLYGLWCLDKHLVIFYQGEYAQGPALADLVGRAVLELCEQLKPEAVATVDALSPPDFALNSVLGRSDGKVYDNLQAAFFRSPGAFDRPSWWKELILKPQVSKL
ncbi:peroxisomal acyl-coenzyme A oxidase 3 [Bacillus rossius redtenbacheri]|uniref:peroxisomal acyl-coenzyme A oxidase 3 n=1 Tax=Bacillus rossius redtenbacheri TaxID=93214 RepID=UPI002FDD9B2B